MKQISELYFPRLYRYERPMEHVQSAVPFARGVFFDDDEIVITQNGHALPTQTKVTSRYPDGSVRFLFVRFMANLPANRGTVVDMGYEKCANSAPSATGLRVSRDGGHITVNDDNGPLSFTVADDTANLFYKLDDGMKSYSAGQFVGPLLKDGNGLEYKTRFDKWEVLEEGPLVTVLSCEGQFIPYVKGHAAATAAAQSVSEKPSFSCTVKAFTTKPFVEIAFRLINSTSDDLHAASLVFGVKSTSDSEFSPALTCNVQAQKGDSVGESGGVFGQVTEENMLYKTTGVKGLPAIEEKCRNSLRMTCGHSNYKTNFEVSTKQSVQTIVDSQTIMKEANEHFIEVFYGTFFCDRTDETSGICATVFQAQQNYPKAVKSDESGIYVHLIPEDVEKVVFASGMSREQKFLLHFHAPDMPLWQIDDRSLIYQMPDRPYFVKNVYQSAGVGPDIFVAPDKEIEDVEIALISKCDYHCRSFGMLNYGDAPDMNYTKQGRGKGQFVWTNNEYDFPHACALIYMRKQERRFLDYMIASASHWMDVDVCHYSKDPLLIGGQWEHTRGHVRDGVMVCSHEWVEGLLDYYHFTGEERALKTAIGIGENILRLLETPAYQVSGESNARETGWALRSLTALYVETGDRRWVEKADWIVGHFKEWSREYGSWVAPYTDNTLIHVGFMISVALGSLMRYYRVFPSAELKELMIGAVDDLMDNCYLDSGLFLYKSLPSLNRLGGNTLLLEAMTIGYELTGSDHYLKAGLKTFNSALNEHYSAASDKIFREDTVLLMSAPTKSFAQSFIPLSVYYKAATDAGIL
ncbi:MAG: glycoside hydrolase family 127 protein [Lachnospiraceae bacterium]|nr:glycoside hydrolase family 127 protein [Lachnospiraceae bacterium]